MAVARRGRQHQVYGRDRVSLVHLLLLAAVVEVDLHPVASKNIKADKSQEGVGSVNRDQN